MKYNNISNEELSIMIDNILNGNKVQNEYAYVDEKQREFISSLQSMVEDQDRALKNYRNLRWYLTHGV